MTIIDQYKPKNLGDWATYLVIGGAAAIAFGVLKKFEFETETEVGLNVGGYKLESELEYDFEIKRAGKHRRGKRGKNRNWH